MSSLQQHEFINIACGTDHILALSKTGVVYAWYVLACRYSILACSLVSTISRGNGQQAQLGRKIIERRKTSGLEPERLALRNIVCIGSGSYHSFAVDKAGVVYAWVRQYWTNLKPCDSKRLFSSII